MKLHERINSILLGTLWILAIVLVLSFWLNTVYNFNIFSGEHWMFVAHLQASNEHISMGFYISIVLAIFAGIFGLYVLLRPKSRKKTLNTPQKPEIPQQINKQNTDIIPTTDPKQSNDTHQPTMQRPPRLHIQLQQRQMTPPVQKVDPVQTPVNIPTDPHYTKEMRTIFEENGYKVLSPRSVLKTPLSLIALGTNETLWIGACYISHEKMTDIMVAFKSIFQETLEDIEIDLNAFIIKPTDDSKVDAILDLDSIDDLSSAIATTPNEPESETDKESGNMDAFAGYIETVLTYLGNK